MTTLPEAGAKSKHTATTLLPLPPLRDLVASVDLSAIVEKYAGPGKRNGRGYLFQCPNPAHPDNSPSFSVFTNSKGVQVCHCLSQCGHIGDALAFLQWVNRCEVRDAADELRSFIGASPITPTLKTPSKPKTIRATQPSGIVSDTAAMRDYLDARGWPEEVAASFGLQVMHDYAGIKRVRHPFRSWLDGQLVETGWQARRLDNSQEMRWLGASGTSLPLYNLPALDADEITHAVICEGPADTITASLALAHLPAWACVGVAGSQSWRDEWAQYFGGLSVVIATDNDEAGEKLHARIVASLSGVASVIMASRPVGNDLTDMAKALGLEKVRDMLSGWDTAEKHAPSCDMSALKVAGLIEVPTITRCKVCKQVAEAGARYCARCARTEEVSGQPWRVCDECNTFALVELGRKCFVSHKCAGHYVEAVKS